MSEIATMIESAAEFGVRLELSDFRRSGNTLLLDGMPADQWFEAMFTDDESPVDRLEDLEI
jgi:hypothetical protein